MKVQRLTYKMWSSNEGVVALYASTLQNMKDITQHILVLGSYLIQHLANENNTESVNKCKVSLPLLLYYANSALEPIPYFNLLFWKGVLLETFIKVAVSVKIKPAVYIVDESRALLKQLTHDEFKSQLLPAVQKAMLRNPEVILECVGHIVSALSLDLSQYAADIGKSLAGKLKNYTTV